MTTGPNRPPSSAIRTESRRAVRIRRCIAAGVLGIAMLVLIVALFQSAFAHRGDGPGLTYAIYISAAVGIVAFPFVGWAGKGPSDLPPDSDKPTRGTRTVVDVFLARLGDGDAAGVAALFAPEIDWTLNWPDDPATHAVPWVRHRPDRDAVEQHFRDLADGNRPATEPTTFDEVLVDGSHAVILGTLRNTIAATERDYSARFALHLVVTDGAITAYHLYEDSLAVALAAGAVTATRE